MTELLLTVMVYLMAGAVAHAATVAATTTHSDIPLERLLIGLAAGGGVLGLGKLLASADPLTPRLVAGRIIVSAGLAVGAGSVLTMIADLPVLAICGLAAVSAVAGEQLLEKAISKRLGISA